MDFTMDPVGRHSPPLQMANAMTTVKIKMCPKRVDFTHQNVWSAFAQTGRVTDDDYQPEETGIKGFTKRLDIKLELG